MMYAEAIQAIETELQQLDARRAKLIAAQGVMRQLVDPNVLPPISVTGATTAANERTNERTNEASARPKPARRSLPNRAATPSPDEQAAVIAALRKGGHPMTPKDLAAALKVNRLRIPKLVAPMAARGLVILTGVRRGRRIALAPQKAIAPGPRADADLEKVWDGTKGSPSLTGDAAGLGSSLSGVSYEVGRRGR